MRTRFVAMLSVLLVIGLLVPTGAWAKRVTAIGSVVITGDNVEPLTNQVVATVITANPGLEKTIVQQLPLPGPLFVAPVFVSAEQGNPGQNDIDTTVFVTNATTSSLTIIVTVYNLNGSPLVSVSATLASRETRVIAVSALLP